MTLSRGLAALSLVLLVAAAIAGFTPVSTDGGIDCGSWIARDYSEAERNDDVSELAGSMIGVDADSEGTKDECKESIGNRTPIVLVLGALAIGCGIAAATTRTPRGAHPV